MHRQLLEHLPTPPAAVLDVGGGAGHQSFPLADAGYDVTLLDPSPAMLGKARQRLQRLPAEVRRREATASPGRVSTTTWGHSGQFGCPNPDAPGSASQYVQSRRSYSGTWDPGTSRSAPVSAVRRSRSTQMVTPGMAGPRRVCQEESPVKQVAMPGDGTVGPPSNWADTRSVRSSSAMSDWLNGARLTDSGR
jgi:hypothetical protein